MLGILLAAGLAASACDGVSADPEALYAESVGLQGYIYGYPVVDLLKQRHNETHIVRQGQPVAAPPNTIVVYPHLLTPQTQGELRAPNADTLYLNAWFDLSRGPVVVSVPPMGARYYTLGFTDLFARPTNVGTRTNRGRASRYALIGPAGGRAPRGTIPIRFRTHDVWMLGRVLVDGDGDVAAGLALARAVRVDGSEAPEPLLAASPLAPTDDVAFFDVLNAALRRIPVAADEAALLAQFDRAGFGPASDFDAARISESTRRGLACAAERGRDVIRALGFRPTSVANGWMLSSRLGDPGHDFLLRAEIARGGYVNDPAEAIYPAAIADSEGAPLTGDRRYRIRFANNGLPPVDAFWSLTAYDARTLQLTENPLRRYAIGDRTRGLRFGADGSLAIELSSTPPPDGDENWLPTPPGPFIVVARLYLPRREALDGSYSLPPIERLAP